MSIDYHNPIAIAGNLIPYSMEYLFAYLILKPRMKGWKIALFSLPILLVGYVLPPWLLMNTGLLRGVIGFSIVFSPILLFYRDSLFKRLLTFFGAWLTFLTTEFIGAFIWTQGTEINYLSFYSLITSVVCILLLIEATIYFSLQKKSALRVAERDRTVLLLIPFTQFISFVGWLRYLMIAAGLPGTQRDAIASIFVVLILNLLADYVFYKSYRRSLATARLEIENAAMSDQLIRQEKLYSALQQQFSAIREIRHDISNHLFTIESLLAEGRHEDAEKYAGAFRVSVLSSTGGRLCQEESVNAFLLYKQEELQRRGIRTDFEVTLPADTGISSVDLVTVLGNLLDNAEEACASLPSPTIQLRLRTQAGSVLIAEENPCGELRERSERITGLPRGTGYAILSGLSEKYNGVFSHDIRDGVYRCSLSLQFSDSPILK